MKRTYAVKLVYEGWANDGQRSERVGFRPSASRFHLVSGIPVGALALVYVCHGPAPGLAGIIKITGTWRDEHRVVDSLDPEWSLALPNELLAELPPGSYVPVSTLGLTDLDAFKHAAWVEVNEEQFYRGRNAIERKLAAAIAH